MDETDPKKHMQIYPYNTVLSEYKESLPQIARSHNKTHSHIENLHCKKLYILRLVLPGNNPTKFGQQVLKAITNYTYMKGSYGFDVATSMEYGVVSSLNWAKPICDLEGLQRLLPHFQRCSP
jgi:hypothetical protein